MEETSKNIVLVGPMGSGKTTVGRRLARELNQGVALGQPMGGQVVVPMKFTSDDGGGVVLDNLQINTENGYDSTINMSNDITGFYASGEVYEVITTHSVGVSTGATIAGASLQFESESGLAELRWAASNGSFWSESGSELVSVMVALSSSTDTADGKQITWRFRINSAHHVKNNNRDFKSFTWDFWLGDFFHSRVKLFHLGVPGGEF